MFVNLNDDRIGKSSYRVQKTTPQATVICIKTVLCQLRDEARYSFRTQNNVDEDFVRFYILYCICFFTRY